MKRVEAYYLKYIQKRQPSGKKVESIPVNPYPETSTVSTMVSPDSLDHFPVTDTVIQMQGRVAEAFF